MSAQSNKTESLKRLVLVTNREPFHLVTRKSKKIIEQTAGGLVSALKPAFQKIQKSIWVSSANSSEISPKDIKNQTDCTWLPVYYNQALHENYYHGFSNRVLWPLFHSMLSREMHYKTEEWQAYKKVNQAFASKINAVQKPGDFIWIHDYHLCLVPELLCRQTTQKKYKVGFFLHIPFPSYEIFRTLPWEREIMKGFLGADIIGFHIQDYCNHFFDCAENILGATCNRQKGFVTFNGRKTYVKAMPISIDTKAIQNLTAQKKIVEKAKKLKSQTGAKYLIAGVDRLDYTKGLIRRLQALELFFEKYPEFQGKVSFIQLAVPSRTAIEQYQMLREEIERLVGHINGLYATPAWTPIKYLYRSLPKDDLYALYLAADIGLVTPLRDGMNLVAKEYVASHKNKTGTLILSKLAGAANELKEAVQVNPYDVETLAKTIAKVLQLSEATKKQKMKKLNKTIEKNDVFSWVYNFLNHKGT